MNEHEFELVEGSGNVFRDFDDPHADLNRPRLSLRLGSSWHWTTGSSQCERPRV